MKFVLNGCDISFIAEAPEDITLKQLEIIIGYDSIEKTSDDVTCQIRKLITK